MQLEEVNRLLVVTKNNTIRKLQEYGLNDVDFMEELAKYNGVISGSFMLMNFGHTNNKNICGALNYFNKPAECDDIDVYVYDPDFLTRTIDYSKPLDFNGNMFFHKFEQFILKKLTKNGTTKNPYLFIDGILYSRMYITEKIKINFILLSKPCIPFINENFDLDCCKIIYDGENVYVHDIESLVQGKSLARYNKCSLDNLYQGKPSYWTQSYPREVRIIHDAVSVRNSLPYIKYKMLHSVYLFNKNIIKQYPKYHHNDVLYTNNKSELVTTNYSGSTYASKYTEYINEIQKTVDLDALFCSGSVLNLDVVQLTEVSINVISMIRTLERIDKYKARGITEITMSLD